MNLVTAYNESVNVVWTDENKETDTEYNIYEDADVIRVAFRGSTSDMDWKQNFMIWKKPYKRMQHLFFVHSGFLKKYKSVRNDIMVRVVSAKKEGKEIEIRGFSQGAGLALLLHEDVLYFTNEYARTIVFGCPRVFSIFNGRLLDDRMLGVTRVQNGNDAVTKMPFLFMLYKHYGRARNIGKKRIWFRFSFKDHLRYGKYIGA